MHFSKKERFSGFECRAVDFGKMPHFCRQGDCDGHMRWNLLLICFCRKLVSEVGFEPTPTFVDQNTPVRKSSTLESGALDRSAILTCHFEQGNEYLFSNSTPSSATPWKPLKPQPFDRCTSHLSCPEQPGELAQMVERSIRIREARGSIPRFSTRKYFFYHPQRLDRASIRGYSGTSACACFAVTNFH